ncbi:uncharacterized [Tachysurus ichikawai]
MCVSFKQSSCSIIYLAVSRTHVYPTSLELISTYALIHRDRPFSQGRWFPQPTSTDYPESPQRICHAIFTRTPVLCTGHTGAPDRHKKQDGCLIMQSIVKGQDTGGEIH